MVRRLVNARERFAEIATTGRPAVGMFVGSSDPAMTDILGDVGYDFVILDAEHSPQGPYQFVNHVRAAEANDCLPFVRTADASRSEIQRYLDIGAEGIVVAHVETPDDAASAVAATRYPTSLTTQPGVRGMCPSRAARYSLRSWDSYVRHTESSVLVIPIIESRMGVANAQAIAAVDGIDYLFFGPGDYSVDIGVSMDAPEVATGWRAVKDAARAVGKKTMTTTNIHGLKPGDATVLVHMVDMLHVNELMADELDIVRARFFPG